MSQNSKLKSISYPNICLFLCLGKILRTLLGNHRDLSSSYFVLTNVATCSINHPIECFQSIFLVFLRNDLSRDLDWTTAFTWSLLSDLCSSIWTTVFKLDLGNDFDHYYFIIKANNMNKLCSFIVWHLVRFLEFFELHLIIYKAKLVPLIFFRDAIKWK